MRLELERLFSSLKNRILEVACSNYHPECVLSSNFKTQEYWNMALTKEQLVKIAKAKSDFMENAFNPSSVKHCMSFDIVMGHVNSFIEKHLESGLNIVSVEVYCGTAVTASTPETISVVFKFGRKKFRASITNHWSDKIECWNYTVYGSKGIPLDSRYFIPANEQALIEYDLLSMCHRVKYIALMKSPKPYQKAPYWPSNEVQSLPSE